MEETKKSKYIPRIQEFPSLYRVNLFIKDSEEILGWHQVN